MQSKLSRYRHSLPLLAALLLGLPVAAQDLVQMPPLGPEIEALPRLAGNSPTDHRVNAQLDLLDADHLDRVTCQGGDHDGAFRSVELLEDGPEFLSFVVTISTYCEGAAHPWTFEVAVNFDLQTGDRTDLTEYLPSLWKGPDVAHTNLSVLYINSVGALPEACLTAYARVIADGHLSVALAVNEAEGSLLMLPSGLAFVDTPCLDRANVPPAHLLEAGFQGKLIRALTKGP